MWSGIKALIGIINHDNIFPFQNLDFYNNFRTKIFSPLPGWPVGRRLKTASLPLLQETGTEQIWCSVSNLEA